MHGIHVLLSIQILSKKSFLQFLFQGMPQPSYDFMPQPSGGLPYGPQPTIGFEVNIWELLMVLVKEDSKMVNSKF